MGTRYICENCGNDLFFHKPVNLKRTRWEHKCFQCLTTFTTHENSDAYQYVTENKRLMEEFPNEGKKQSGAR